MARICPLFSGSSGNSSFVATAGGGLLIDAGVSCKRLFTALKSIDIEPCAVSSVLITHEHSDHIAGLRVFLKKTGARLYASAEVLEFLCENGHVPPEIDINPVEPGRPFEIEGAEVKGFSLSHDSVAPLGYHLTLPDGRTAAVATDLGRVTEPVAAALSGADLVILEANYDPLMLAEGPYPYFLKQRILSEVGHLSNKDSGSLAARLIASGATRIILAHLSRENNSPSLARETVERVLMGENMRPGVDFSLSVAPRSGPGEMFVY